MLKLTASGEKKKPDGVYPLMPDPDSEPGAGPPPVRVLDVSSTLGGAYCSRLLSATGASVTRVEPPGGHWLRRWSASGATIPAGESGALFQWLAGGQRSVTVDPDRPDDVDEVLAWAGAVDAVVWTPGGPLTAPGIVDLDRRGDGAPGVVVTAVTPFGLTGPWSDRAATEFTLQALSGGPALRGSRAWPPMSAGGQHGEWMIGVFAAVATMVGLRRLALTGEGGVLDVSSLESVLMTQLFNPITAETMAGGRRPVRPRATVADVAPTKDGFVGFAVVNRLQHWHDFCAMIGQPEWAADASLDPFPNRSERSDELNKVIHDWTTARTTAEIVELGNLMRIPTTDIGNGRSIPRMDQFAAGGFYGVNPGGGFLQPESPWRFTPPLPGIGASRAAPAPGPPITTAGRPPAPPRRSKPDPSALTRPFEGLRVADFTSFWAGPFLTHTLAMFGADVIHVESTVRPDGSRLMGYHSPDEPKWWEWSPYFQATNTNKRAITLDMRREEGRALAHRLVAACDVIVENYSPRVLDSWGLDWDGVHALNPRAIMVRMPAFGLTGPWRDRTGFAMTMEQVSGMAWISGFPEHEPGALFGPCDPGAGLHTAIGLMAALAARGADGEGVLVEAPMVAGGLNVAAEQVIEYSAYGALLYRSGNRGPAAAPQNCYLSGDVDDAGEHKRWVAVAVADDRQWSALVDVLGRPAWAVREDLGTSAGRHRHHDEIDAELAAWCRPRDAAEIVARLASAGVPVAPVVEPHEQLEFQQLAARRFFETVGHPVSGPAVHVTYPFRLPGHDGPLHRHPAPTLGQHNTEVLREVLGLTDAEIAALRAAGITGEDLAS
jgi:crotonobetainyl-CoA:carnitine CoA-transferase CaiB-like acyl-CoA transferase